MVEGTAGNTGKLPGFANIGFCVSGRDQNKNLVLSNESIKVELPP